MSEPLHQSWKTWVALALMLAAIAMYMFSLDDATDPLESDAPAAAEGAAP